MDSLSRLAGYRCPEYQHFPLVPLYKDQVVSFLGQAVAPFYEEGASSVTAAMVNNYVKLKVISPPERKKYSREQLICLYIIFLLKQVLTMEELKLLLQREFSQEETELSYRYFAARLEAALQSLSDHTISQPPIERPLLDAAIRSFVYRQCVSALLCGEDPAHT